MPKVQDSSFRSPISDCLENIIIIIIIIIIIMIIMNWQKRKATQEHTKQTNKNKQTTITHNINKSKSKNNRSMRVAIMKKTEIKTKAAFLAFSEIWKFRSCRIPRCLRSRPLACVHHKSKIKRTYIKGSIIFVARWFFTVAF